MRLMNVFLTSAALALFPGLAQAACNVQGNGEVNVVMNFFPTTELLNKEMKACERDGLRVDNKLTTEHKQETERAFGGGKSPYDAAHVANGSVTPLQAKGQLMKLNDLVAKYKDKYKIEDSMLIKVGDDVVAVAFMANAQIFYYRKDLFDKLGLKPPQTFDDILADAEALKKDSSVPYAYGAAYKSGWELANDFVDIYLAMGGQLFDPVTGEAAFENKQAVESLELMKKLMAYMSPNALSIDFGGVKQQLEQGQVGMAFLWGDLAASMDNPAESKVADKVAFAPAPSLTPGGPPATTFWWDGYVIPKNLDGDPDLTFQVLMESLKPEVVAEYNDTTLWLRSNYKPNKYSEPIIESVSKGAPPYPMLPQSGLAHAALGDNIGDFLAGKESAEQSLADAAKAYRKSAVDAGYLK